MSVVRLGRRAMGTVFEVLLFGDRAVAEEALDLVDRLEEQMSLFLPTSEICRINERAAFEAVKVEPRLFRLLLRARELFEETGGAFDAAMGMRQVRLSGGTVRFCRPGPRFDLGGIGKGFALDCVVELLKARGVESAFLHGGASTIYALGAPPGEEGWRVGLIDPRDPEHRFGSLTLRDEALSTSSNALRDHVLDPRTGKPAGGVCAWALARTATDADALSTAYLVHGRIDGPAGRGLLLDDGLTCQGVEPELYSGPRGGGLSRRDFIRGTAAAAAAFGVGLGARGAVAQEGEAPDEVRVAVVGLGEQGRLLLQQLVRMKGVKVPALCDLKADALAEAVKTAGRGVETYRDFGHLLDEEDIDAVVIATPTHLHTEPALASLARGKHVFSEAPLARTIEDCRKIAAAAAQASGQVFQVGHQRRCSKLYPHALSHIKSRAIGRILQVRAQHNKKSSWRRPGGRKANWRLFAESSGGLLLEQGSHVFDLAHWYLRGALPEEAAGIGSLLKWKDGREVDDSVQVVLRYAGGVQVNFGASLVNSYGDQHEIIVGDAASILLARQHKGLLFKESDTVAAGWEQYARKEMLGTWRGIVLDAEATKYEKHDEGQKIGPDADKADYHAELEQFLTAVRKGGKPACGAREGMVAAVTAIVAEQALANHTVVKFTKEHFA